MQILKKIKKGIRNPIAALILIFGFEKFRFIPDKIYLSIMYRYYFGSKLNLKDPRTFNEKLQWLKLYNRKDEYVVMVDKYLVREYISNKIGSEYLIPLLGVWENPEDIDFDELPEKFVLKCNHNSGTGMYICKAKKDMDVSEVKRNLKIGLKEDYYYLGREWPYKNVPRKIIAEQFMVDESGYELKDYKVMCFGGEPKLIELHQGRFTDHQSQDYYNLDWKKTNISQGNVSGFGCSNTLAPKPECFEKMIELSKILSKDIPHVRIDWYVVNHRLYFGEITFFDGSGFDKYDNADDDVLLGDWISLPK